MHRTAHSVVSLFFFGALLGAFMACSKEKEQAPAGAKPTAETQNPGPAAARAPGAARMEVPKPKPMGPLPSKQGTRFARLETIQSGRFTVTVLQKNRLDVEAIEAKELVCSIMCDGKSETTNLVGKPTPEEEKEGKCSRFQGYSDAVVSGKTVTLVVTFPAGEPKLAQFELPAGYRTY